MRINPPQCPHTNQDHLGVNHQGYAIFWCEACGAHYNADLMHEPGEGWTYPEPPVTQGPPPAANPLDATARLLIESFGKRVDQIEGDFKERLVRMAARVDGLQITLEHHRERLDVQKTFFIQLRQDVAELKDLKSKLMGALGEQRSGAQSSQSDS